MSDNSYRGRFAPSPTGPLHFGSLVAAVGSYLEARSQQGEWLLRVEDVDVPRCKPEHEAAILRTLVCYGFRWDGDILRQSQRSAVYQDALNRLFYDNHVFGCACTRKEIGDSNLGSDGAAHVEPQGGELPLPPSSGRGLGGRSLVYPGTCRAGLPEGKEARAFRLRVNESTVSFIDAVQGKITQNLATEVGDFVLLRADGLFAYQLAVVVDDYEQNITHVVRGADLLDSTPRQIYLQQCLGVPTPAYAHLPVVVNAAGEKLSKQTLAEALNDNDPLPALWQALAVLGQNPPDSLRQGERDALWDWAIKHWSLAQVPQTVTTPLPVIA